jgi:ABC-2 type transport system permease protein
MMQIYLKEVSAFFSSLIGYIVVGVFLLFLGLIIWVFPDYSILYYYYASLDQLFDISPLVFLFLIPAVTMRTYAEEQQNTTLELLQTKPITARDIVLGKYLASLTLVLVAILPTVLYFYTVHELGSPKGNIDNGAILGSYIGLIFLAACFAAIGTYASSLTSNQIVSFLLSAFLCFVIYWGFFYLSKLPVFVGTWDDLIQKIGMDHHYRSMSRGVLDTRNVIYFITVIYLFLGLTSLRLKSEKI